MNRTVLTVGVVALVALAGCSGLLGSEQSEVGDNITLEDDSSGAENVTQSIGIEVDESTAGEELTEIGATYPRDNFTVHAAQHDEIRLGVDTDGDGESEQTFNESHVSGVNNNAYSVDVALETGYTLESGDVVMLEYPGVDNPTESGDYTVEIRLNDHQTSNATLTVE